MPETGSRNWCRSHSNRHCIYVTTVQYGSTDLVLVWAGRARCNTVETLYTRSNTLWCRVLCPPLQRKQSPLAQAFPQCHFLLLVLCFVELAACAQHENPLLLLHLKEYF